MTLLTLAPMGADGKGPVPEPASVTVPALLTALVETVMVPVLLAFKARL